MNTMKHHEIDHMMVALDQARKAIEAAENYIGTARQSDGVNRRRARDYVHDIGRWTAHARAWTLAMGEGES